MPFLNKYLLPHLTIFSSNRNSSHFPAQETEAQILSDTQLAVWVGPEHRPQPVLTLHATLHAPHTPKRSHDECSTMVWDGHSRTYADHESNERQTETQADGVETRARDPDWETGKSPFAPLNLGAISKTS